MAFPYKNWEISFGAWAENKPELPILVTLVFGLAHVTSPTVVDNCFGCHSTCYSQTSHRKAVSVALAYTCPDFVGSR